MEITSGTTAMSKREKLCAGSPGVQWAQNLQRFLLLDLPVAAPKMAALMYAVLLYKNYSLKDLCLLLYIFKKTMALFY